MDLTGLIVFIDYFFSVVMEYMDKILKLLGIKWVEEESGTSLFDKIFG